MSNILNSVSSVLRVNKNTVEIFKNDEIAKTVIDKLVWEAVFGSDSDKKLARWLIWEIAQSFGIKPSSINDLYMAKGRGEIELDFTVPAINIRGIAYDMARAVFATAKRMQIGAFVCELARSEMGYTDQAPSEFATVILAAAIKESWQGPVFIQCDHFQAKAEVPGIPKADDLDALKTLIKDSIVSGFYNVDIDMSTLVDLSKPTEKEQQEANIKYSAEFTNFVRSLEPKAHPISIGGEIGHIGGKNSTLADFKAFIEGYNAAIGNLQGISKVALQTGTSHGGVVLPDGTLAKVDIDFPVLMAISKFARDAYKIGGAVQHGASTLPEDLFNQFPKSGALEIHLATEFQNIIMDHPKFPKDLLASMYQWLDNEQQKEREEGQTNEQFHYKLRKKAWGKFKKACWQIPENDKAEIREALAKKFEFLFNALNVKNTNDLIKRYIKVFDFHRQPSDFGLNTADMGDVSELSD